MGAIKTDTWYARYPADYVKDTLLLTLEEDGFYSRALDQVYIFRGRIPAEPVRLQLLLRVTPEQWDRCQWILERFFYRDGDTYGNHRADIEIARAQGNAKKAQENGKKGGRPSRGNQSITQEKPNRFSTETQTVSQENPKGNPDHNPEKSSSPSPSPSDREDPPISPKGGHLPDLPALVITYLNEKTGKRFRPETAANRKPILARAASGFVLEDFRKVIDNKVADWLDDPKMNEYLCPETLFRPGKFEKYLNQSSAGASDGAHSKPAARGYETAQQRKDRRLREVMARYGSPRGSNPDAHHPALHLGEEGTPGGRSAGHGDEVGNG